MEKARILIVEDEAIVAEDLKMAITDAGYDVVGCATTAEDAVNAAIELKPDLILMDIVLFGHKNGIDASYEIKKKRDIPIIFLTAYSDSELIGRAKNVEPYAYIVKPFQERQLFASIEMAMYKSRMERKLKESETKFRNLTELLPQTVFETDETGNLTFTNRAGFDYFGYTQDDLGRGLTALQMISPEDRDRAKERVEQVIKGEQLDGTEYTMQRKDGSIFPAIMYSAPILHENRPVGMRGIIADITEHKQAEEALQRSEKRYHRMVSNIPGLVYQSVMHSDGSIAFSFVSENCRKLFGIEPDEVERDADVLLDLIHPDDRAEFYRSIANSAASLSPWEWEGQSSVSGDERWFRYIACPERQETGDVLWDGIIMDVTEQKLAKNRIEEEYRRAEFYIDLMSHDVNNANQITSGYLDLLLRAPDFPDGLRKYAEIALNHVRKSADIIANVKTLSEVRSNVTELERIDIYPAYRSAVETVMSQPGDVKINSRITNGKYFIRGNSGISSVFTNLLSNAVKFDRHDTVTIDVDIGPSDDDRYWKIEFKDRGHGISDDYKMIIFNRLERIGESAQGTGLGLTLVKYIVESCGGSIWVEDRVKGDPTQGSNFALLLPKED